MGGLDTLPDAIKVALLVRDVTGREPRDPRPLGSGVTSMGWRVETDDGPLVVLIELPRSEDSHFGPRYGSQLALLDALHTEGLPVPAPIACNADPEHADAARFEQGWAIIGAAVGTPGPPEALSDEGARDLGRLLARLHTIPGTGFGLADDRRDALSGSAPTMATGLLERWPTLWPFDRRSLLTHPVARLAPRLIEPTSRFREAIQRFGLLTRAVPVHSDLNPEHLYIQGGRLATLIDFSDNFLGPPAADFSTFAAHYGWDRVGVALGGYTDSEVLRETRLAEAQLFSVALGLYRIQKRVALQQPPERVQRDVAFLETTIEAAGHLLRG